MLLKYCIPRRNWLFRGVILFGVIGFVFFGYYYRNAIHGKVTSLTKDLNWMKSVPVTARNFPNNSSQSVQSQSKVDVRNKQIDRKTEKRFESESRESDRAGKFEATEFKHTTYEMPNRMGSTQKNQTQFDSHETNPIQKVSTNESKSDLDSNSD